jgi:hypothetical protein
MISHTLKNKSVQKMAVILLLSIPILIAISWYALNLGYPRTDEGDYFITAQQIHHSFTHKDFISGIKDLYLNRGWKPVFHPLWALPGLMLTQGKVLPSVAAPMLIFFALYLSFCFLILKKYMPPLNAALGTFILSMTVWVVDSYISFNSKLPIMVFLLLTFYLFLRITEGANFKFIYLFSLAWALAAWQRPVESLLYMAVPLFYIFYELYRRKTLPKHARSILIGIAIFGTLTFVWYGPFIDTLYDWIFASSYGRTSRLGFCEDPGYLGFWWKFLRDIGGVAALIVSMCALASSTRILTPKFLVLSMGTALLPVFLGSLTHNCDIRYYFLSGAILFMLGFIYALNPKGRYLKSRLLLMTILALLMLTQVTLNTFKGENAAQPLKKIFSPRYYMPPPLRVPEPALELVGGLSLILPSKEMKIGLLPYSTKNDLEWTLDPWLMTVVALEKELPWIIEKPKALELTALMAPQRWKAEYKNYDFFLTGPLEGFVKLPLNPQSLWAELLIKAYHQGNLSKMGVKLVGTVPFSDWNGDQGQLLILAPISK